jgi:oligopeptide/dipeptide ABC transporter ATP-binding protein
VPDPDVPPVGTAIEGEPPSPVLPPSGCRFHPRCPYASEQCTATEPALRDLGGGHFVACHHPIWGAASSAAAPTDGAAPD